MSDDANNDPIGSSLGINPIQKTEKPIVIIVISINFKLLILISVIKSIG